jgi:hypothetical protein
MPSLFLKPIVILSAIVFQCSISLAQDTPSNQLVLPEEPFEAPFVWKGDSINGQWEHYAAMLIPVKLEGCPKQFYMQFDLGAPYSLFYRNKPETINSRYPLRLQLSDSAWQGNAIEIIGTLGTDLIGSKAVMIDYPGKKIIVCDTIPEKPGLMLTDFIYANRSIILPALIKGKKTLLFFDSGSSAFELLTNKETTAMLAQPGVIPATYPVTSWGKILTAVSYTSSDSIEIAAVKMPLNRVTYIEGASDAQVNRMMKMGIGGMTGNKLFLHSILMLDIKNKRFGIFTEQ